uniref:ATP synthase F0 subunit 8 n=1 Tax=Stereobalanus canadensis TaxID=560612 RepID=A0A3S7SG29_9BILA|nr:ATP synthase F0 subunit 8 [Stereobalanus canadensis]AXY64125.1 ATP synthase F0 subunit 8 [Stereobalanus canadensis]
MPQLNPMPWLSSFIFIWTSVAIMLTIMTSTPSSPSPTQQNLPTINIHSSPLWKW